MAEYQRHEPKKTLLHEVVREQLEDFLANSASREQPAPRFIEQELRAFLRCGVLAHGFLRLHCDECGHDRLVACPASRSMKWTASCRDGVANDGHDTRAIQHYLGHKNITHTTRYTEPAPDRFKGFWGD